jgi:hypothetical protein
LIRNESRIRYRGRNSGKKTTGDCPDDETNPEVDYIVAGFGDDEAGCEGCDRLCENKREEEDARVYGGGGLDDLIELRKL